MTPHRTPILIVAGLGLTLGLLSMSPPRGTAAPDVTATYRPASEDSIVVAFARRYGIEVDLADVIHRTAVDHALEPAAVFGLIATESSFNPRAVGRAGSVGLMQVKPSTARGYDPQATRERLFNPEFNLRVGMAHLRRELAHFRNDWTLGLLSYNMGRARLSRALARGVIPRNAYASKVLAHCGKLCT